MKTNPNHQKVRDKIKASNQARTNLEALFANFKERTGRVLSIHSSFGEHFIFEGRPPHDHLADGFQSHFNCIIEAEEYFSKALQQR